GRPSRAGRGLRRGTHSVAWGRALGRLRWGGEARVLGWGRRRRRSGVLVLSLEAPLELDDALTEVSSHFGEPATEEEERKHEHDEELEAARDPRHGNVPKMHAARPRSSVS